MKVTGRPALWRVLAHPARRRLIELLHDGPKTTGQLAEAFAVSRFAVMKHLAVLHANGLITVDRRGRERWNELVLGSHLDLPGFSRVARSPDRESAAGSQSPVPDDGKASPGQGLTPIEITLRVFLEATPARVFDALTFNVAAWWGPPFLRSPEATNVVLEAHLGGRLYEEWGHRQGFIRGFITAVRRDERLEITGAVAGCSPLPSTLEFSLEGRERGTLLTTVHRGVALDKEEARRQETAFAAAWNEMLSVRLKAFVEDGVRSGMDQPASDEQSDGRVSQAFGQLRGLRF